MRVSTSWIAVAIALAGALSSQDNGEEAGPTIPQVGDLAPVFRLNDHDGDMARVGGEADDWTVLAFYPKAMTPG